MTDFEFVQRLQDEVLPTLRDDRLKHNRIVQAIAAHLNGQHKTIDQALRSYGLQHLRETL